MTSWLSLRYQALPVVAFLSRGVEAEFAMKTTSSQVALLAPFSVMTSGVEQASNAVGDRWCYP